MMAADLDGIEKELSQVAVEIDACVQQYTGLRIDEYYGQIGGEGNLIPIAPQLPRGMVDAEDFGRIIAEQEKDADTAKAAVKANDEELLKLERAMSLLGTPDGAALAGLGAVYGGRGFHDPVVAMQQRKQQLERARVQLTGQQAGPVAVLWRHAMAFTVIDGRGFQEELASLLERKLALTLDKKRRAAERILALRQAAKRVSALRAAEPAADK